MTWVADEFAWRLASSGARVNVYHPVAAIMMVARDKKLVVCGNKHLAHMAIKERKW